MQYRNVGIIIKEINPHSKRKENCSSLQAECMRVKCWYQLITLGPAIQACETKESGWNACLGAETDGKLTAINNSSNRASLATGRLPSTSDHLCSSDDTSTFQGDDATPKHCPVDATCAATKERIRRPSVTGRDDRRWIAPLPGAHTRHNT